MGEYFILENQVRITFLDKRFEAIFYLDLALSSYAKRTLRSCVFH